MYKAPESRKGFCFRQYMYIPFIYPYAFLSSSLYQTRSNCVSFGNIIFWKQNRVGRVAIRASCTCNRWGKWVYYYFFSFCTVFHLFSHPPLFLTFLWRWSGVAKVSCILRHQGVKLIFAYSLARLAILVAGKGRVGKVFISSVSSLSFIFISPLSFSFISSTLSSISFLPFSGRWHKMTHKGWPVIKPQHNQSVLTSLR